MATIFRPPIFVTISPRRKAADEWSVNLRVLYAPNPAVPFNQLDWPLATRAKAKAVGEAISGAAPLYTPNPAGPFNQSDWLNATLSGRSQKSDYAVNLLPLQTPVAVAAPFNQTDWPLSTPSRKPIPVDTVELLLPLYVTLMPFVGLTETRTFARQAVKSDIFVNLLPLQAAPVIFPFSLRDWSTVARPRFTANVDLIERSASLYTPNPDRPFIDPIMMNSNAARKPGAIVDAFVNLLPPQNPPPPGGHVFEWLTRARRRGRR